MRRTWVRARRDRRGLTLIEISIGLAIMAMVVGVAVISVGELTHASLRSSALELTGAIKFTYDRAIMEKRIQRIGIDLDQNVWWIEYTEDPYTVAAEKLKGKAGEALADPTQELEEKEKSIFDDDDGDEEVNRALEGGKSARFLPDTEVGQPRPLEGDVRFSKVWTGHQEEPFTAGVAYLHFFKGGFTEPAAIELTDGGENYFTLEVQPLTGRVTTKPEAMNDKKLKAEDDDDPELEGDE
jgi:prepilin-type N-terminal cleavage/methylation domain-containing protein